MSSLEDKIREKEAMEEKLNAIEKTYSMIRREEGDDDPYITLDNIYDPKSGERDIDNDPLFMVIRTLIIGKQSVKKVKDKIIHHKVPIGYVLQNMETGEKIAVEHLEATVFPIEYGVWNAKTIQTNKVKNGVHSGTFYIKAESGMLSLQQPSFVTDPRFYLGQETDVYVTKNLASKLLKGNNNRAASNKKKSEYDKETMLNLIKDRMNAQNLDTTGLDDLIGDDSEE